MIELSDCFSLFALGLPIGALIGAFGWVIGLAIHFFISLIRRNT